MSSRRSSTEQGPSEQTTDEVVLPSPYTELAAPNKQERKTRQLCGQVAEAVSLALAECDDPVLNELLVEAVQPAPSASRLRVIVSAPPGASAPGIFEALEKVRGYLRHEVAGQISRKRTPELCFELAPPGAKLVDPSAPQ